MIGIAILASGSNANSMVVSFGNTHILLDAGLSRKLTFERMLDAGIRPEGLAACLVSHEHMDHIGALPQIAGKLPDMPIYLSRGTLGKLKVGEFRRPKFMVFETGASFKVRDVEVQTFAVSHMAADPVGFTLTCGGVRLGFATDLGMVTDTVSSALSGSDVICIESNHDESALMACGHPEQVKRRSLSDVGHLSNDECAKFLESGIDGTSLVILTHLSSVANREDICRMTAELAVAGRCKVQIAGRDGGVS